MLNEELSTRPAGVRCARTWRGGFQLCREGGKMGRVWVEGEEATVCKLLDEYKNRTVPEGSGW